MSLRKPSGVVYLLLWGVPLHACTTPVRPSCAEMAPLVEAFARKEGFDADPIVFECLSPTVATSSPSSEGDTRSPYAAGRYWRARLQWERGTSSKVCIQSVTPARGPVIVFRVCFMLEWGRRPGGWEITSSRETSIT